VTTDFRALCAELEEAYTWCIEEYMTDPAEQDTLIQRARAALAQPEPEGPTDEEIIQWGSDCADATRKSEAEHYWAFEVPSDYICEITRAVLAHWGTPNSAEVRRSLGGAPQPTPVSDAFAVVQKRLDQLAGDQEMMIYRWHYGEWSIDHSNPSSCVQLGEASGEYSGAGRTLEEAFNKLAVLLHHDAPPVPVLPEGTQVIEPTERTLLVPVAQPIPVSERLPGPGDCDAEGRCWWGVFQGDELLMRAWHLERQTAVWRFACWLPAHALPVPTHTSENV